MEFGLLGSLQIKDDDGDVVDLGGVQPRLVLAVLLVAANRVVATDQIVDAVWGESPPPSAAGTLQSYISRLRRRLEPGRARADEPAVLRFEPPGYRLTVVDEHLDFKCFESQADVGRALVAASRFDEGRTVLRDAESLWRGPALAEYRYHEFAAGLIARLEDRRVAALVDRLTADLALGRHAAIIGEAAELVAAHPLQEGLRAQLGLALYRSGRQAEALRVIADARTILRDELGVDPGHGLQELEAAILAQDRALDLETAPSPPVTTTTTTIPTPTPTTTSSPTTTTTVDRDAAELLVGRVHEMDLLRGALIDAGTATRAVIIEGEPGIGKTRLAEELGVIAGAAGATVTWGRAFEGGAAPSFWPWLPPLRALVHDTPLDGPSRAALDQLVAPSGPVDATTAETSRYALFDAVVELLRSRARQGPLVIVLDDLQWADVSSLELLTAVTGRLTDVALLVIVTVRELDVGRNDELVDALAALTRRSGTRRLQLRGLPAADTAELVVRTTGDAVDPGLLPLIHDRAEGNPFYVTELARLLATGDPLADVPSGVRDVVRRRLALLPERSSELLRVAAIIGRGFDLELLARTAGDDLESCLDLLEAAVVQRLVVPVADQLTTFRFAHALVREVIVDGLSALARARLHLRVADALPDTDDNAEILAEHLWAASAIGAGARAADALERAAHVAIRRRAFSAAEHLLERAVPLRRAAGSDREAQETELRTIELLISVIGARRGQAALVDTELLHRGKELAVTTEREQRLHSLLWVEWAGLDQACVLEKADPIAARLLAFAQRDESPLSKVIGHEAWGIQLWQRGRIADAAVHFDEAVAAGRLLPPDERSALLEPDQLRLPLPFSVYVHDLMGDWVDPAARYAEAIDVMPGDPYWELVVRNFEAWGAVAAGHAERTEHIARRGMEIDPEVFSVFWSMQLRCFLGVALCQQGRVDEGLPIIRESWATYSAHGLRVNGVMYFTESALALARAGRIDEAAATLADAEAVRARDGERHADALLLVADAVLAAVRGDDDAVVRDIFTAAHATTVEQGARSLGSRVVREARAWGHALGVD